MAVIGATTIEMLVVAERAQKMPMLVSKAEMMLKEPVSNLPEQLAVSACACLTLHVV